MSKPEVQLTGQDGNIFNLLAIAGQALDAQSKSEMTNRVFDAESYEAALNIIGEYVDII